MTLRDIKYRSATWRRAQRKLRKKLCVACGSPHGQLELHHIHYENLSEIDSNQTMTLCTSCHFLIHLLSRQLNLNIEQIGPTEARDLAFDVTIERSRQLSLPFP
jgi:hypothetical protein